MMKLPNHKQLDFFSNFINFLKQQGYVFASSQIYGGLANAYDLGPYGTLLKNKLVKAWRDYFLTYEPNAYEIDSKIILNSQIWKASGHLENFQDALIEDLSSQKRYRLDHLLATHFPEHDFTKASFATIETFLKANLKELKQKKVTWGPIRHFNLLFETQQGVIEKQKTKLYLRPETAQGIFINFKNIHQSMRNHLPFIVGQVGKAFRNEITPGNFIFRTREFEQMELEVFVSPDSAPDYYQLYLQKSWAFLLSLGLEASNLKIYEQKKDELAHYALATSDILFHFPFGWNELMGIANRADHDLKIHSLNSLEELYYLDPHTQKKIIPFVIEPSIGLERLLLAFLLSKYRNLKTRQYLDLDQAFAPFEIALLPLTKKQNELLKVLEAKCQKLKIRYKSEISGSIGKRYARQDAIGIKYCLTIDYQSLEDQLYTLRERNTMEQRRLSWEEIVFKIKCKRKN